MRRADIGDFYPTGFDGIGQRQVRTGLRSRKLSTAWHVSESLEPP